MCGWLARFGTVRERATSAPFVLHGGYQDATSRGSTCRDTGCLAHRRPPGRRDMANVGHFSNVPPEASCATCSVASSRNYVTSHLVPTRYGECSSACLAEAGTAWHRGPVVNSVNEALALLGRRLTVHFVHFVPTGPPLLGLLGLRLTLVAVRSPLVVHHRSPPLPWDRHPAYARPSTRWDPKIDREVLILVSPDRADSRSGVRSRGGPSGRGDAALLEGGGVRLRSTR
jgi:hypothetical protein